MAMAVDGVVNVSSGQSAGGQGLVCIILFLPAFGCVPPTVPRHHHPTQGERSSISLVNQPYFSLRARERKCRRGNNNYSSGHTCTDLRAGRNV